MSIWGSPALSADAERIAATVRPSVVLVETASGHGSGLIWDAGGLVVSNYHVAPRGRARLELADGRIVDAAVVRSDPVLDLAVLRVIRPQMLADELSPACIGDTRALRVGSVVLAVGNPLGIRGSVALGIVSAVGNGTWMGRTRQDILQADIRLAPGNSGGPIVDVQGRVVGIASMVLSPGAALAVPAHVVRRYVGEPAVDSGPQERPRGRGIEIVV